MTHSAAVLSKRQQLSHKLAARSEQIIALNRAAHANRKRARATLASPGEILLRLAQTHTTLTREERAACTFGGQLTRVAPDDCLRSAHRMADNPRFAD